MPDQQDPLAFMFGMQNDLQVRLNPEDWKEPHYFQVFNEEGQKYVTEELDFWLKCIEQESAEARDWTPWKRWSRRLGNKNDDIIPWSHEHVKEIRMELIDMFHFWMNACMVLGMTPEMVFELYKEKNNINHERQDSGTY